MELTYRNREGIGELRHGVDAVKLAEFPLASTSNRLETKTVLFEDQVHDPITKKLLQRRLTLSDSDKYGMPTGTNVDVLLAGSQISKLADFQDPKVFFCRDEILKLLGWKVDTRNHYGLEESRRGWSTLTV